MRMVLVTGASGFVGMHVVEALSRGGLNVRCLVRPTSRVEYIRHCNPELVEGDVLKPESLPPALEGVEGVVHCAGLTKARRMNDLYRVNRDGAENLYRACAAAGTRFKAIVHIGSQAALGPARPGGMTTESQTPAPVSTYGRSKLEGQRVAESFMPSLPVTVLLPSSVYGPADRDFLSAFRLAKRGIVTRIGRQTPMSFVYAEDLAEAVVLCLSNRRARGKTFLVDDGGVHTMERMGRTIAEVMGRDIFTVPVPLPFALLVARIAELQSAVRGKATILNREKVREYARASWVCSSRRIRDDLGFSPACNLRAGVKRTIEWYRKHGWL